MAKIFLDTNVALDIALKRVPHFTSASELMDLAEVGTVDVYLSECSITDMVYIATEIYKAGQPGINGIIKLIEGSHLLSVPGQIYVQALESQFHDKEDAIQYYIALHHQCDYFITRNEKDFQPHASSSLPVKSPVNFRKEIQPPS